MKRVILLMLIVFLITGCNKKDNIRQVNVLNWSSYIPSEVIVGFEKETGIKINYGTYSSNEELLAKVSNAKDGTYDVIFPSDYMIEIMKKRNMLEIIEHDKLKNIHNLNTNYLNLEYDILNNYSLPFVVTTTLIAYNSEVITEEIKSYNDLLNPKYENEIVLIDDQRIVIGMALLANGFNMNSTDYNELQVAKEWLLKLKDNIKAYDSDSPKNFLISKEASIAVLWNAEGALATMYNNDIKTVFPKEGIALSIDNFAIVKGAKNTSEAYTFIDYVLRPDVMKLIIESYPYKNINKYTDNLLGQSYLSNPASNIADSTIASAYFVKNIGTHIKEYDKLWIEIK